MSNIITAEDSKSFDIDTLTGCYEYIGEFFNKHGAHSVLWSCLAKLFNRQFSKHIEQNNTELKEENEKLKEDLRDSNDAYKGLNCLKNALLKILKEKDNELNQLLKDFNFRS